MPTPTKLEFSALKFGTVGTVHDPRKDLAWNDQWRVTGKRIQKIDGEKTELVSLETVRRLVECKTDRDGEVVISRKETGKPAQMAPDIPYEWFTPLEAEPAKQEAPRHHEAPKPAMKGT